MNFEQALEQIVEKGIEAARESYCKPHHYEKLRGSLAGFEACRGLQIPALAELLEAARHASQDARDRQDDKYWFYRCYEAEVEWVCNCVSVILHNHGMPVIIHPTSRAYLHMATILGVKQ